MLACNILSLFKSDNSTQRTTNNSQYSNTQGDTLSPDTLRPLSSEQLFKQLSLKPMLIDIRRLIPVSDDYWDKLYYQAVLNTAQIMQCLPASQAHHHAGPGGLIKHTLEVIRHTMRIVKNYQLPKGVGPEERAKREHRWRYGVFIAALLHDVGKTLAMVQITLHLKNGDEKHWSPYLGQMPGNTEYYSIKFNQNNVYKLQQHLSATLFNLIPETARDWLLQDMQLMSELIAYLNGDLYECGVVGEIVRQADMESTARDLRLGGHSLRFPGATMLPLVDRLMTGLRHLLSDGALKINQKGSTGWTKDGKAYLVCRTVASAVQQYLGEQHGATDIPRELTRLYDTWQEHGFALPNEKNSAIWKVAIKGDDYQHELTVLVFETDRLFKVGHSPKDFTGSIKVLEQNSSIEQKSQISVTESNQILPETTHGVVAENNTATATVNEPVSTTSETATVTTITSEKRTNTQVGSTTLPCFDPEAESTNALLTDTTSSEQVATGTVINTQGTDTVSVSQTQGTGAVNELTEAIGEPPEATTLEIADHFFEWIRYRLRCGQLYVNRPNARVHRIEQGIALISPAILQDYCKSMQFPVKSNDKETWKVVQKYIHKRKAHIKTKRNNLHKIIVKGDRNQSTLNVYLFETDFFYPDIKPPEINSKVILVEV